MTRPRRLKSIVSRAGLAPELHSWLFQSRGLGDAGVLPDIFFLITEVDKGSMSELVMDELRRDELN